MFAVSPCSSVFSVWSFLCDVSLAASAFWGTPLLLRLAGGIGGMRPVIGVPFATLKGSILGLNATSIAKSISFPAVRSMERCRIPRVRPGWGLPNQRGFHGQRRAQQGSRTSRTRRQGASFRRRTSRQGRPRQGQGARGQCEAAFTDGAPAVRRGAFQEPAAEVTEEEGPVKTGR